MHYKTIVLELLTDRPELKRRLQKYRQLRTTLEFYAHELKASHLRWQRTLAQRRPASDYQQVASEALELAIADLESRLPSGSPENLASARQPNCPAPSSNE
jgi:biopolymer transport protein ExbB/TolQ